MFHNTLRTLSYTLYMYVQATILNLINLYYTELLLLRDIIVSCL